MALDRSQNYEGVSTTSNVTPTLGVAKTAGIMDGYLSSWNVCETAGTPAAAQIRIRDRLPLPGAITSAADGAAGNSTVGLHMFMVSYVTKHGESFRGALLEFTTAGSKIITLTGVPTCPLSDTQVLGRRIYETKAGAPATGVTPTTAQWFRIVADASTTLAAGMNALYLPQASITVGSTTGFAASGNILVTGRNGPEIVAYTSVDATHFLGCTGGTGLLATSDTVTQPMIGDNTTTTYSANTADASLTATTPPTVDKSGRIIENIKLAAGQAIGELYANGIKGSNGGGFYTEVVSGTVDWTLTGS